MRNFHRLFLLSGLIFLMSCQQNQGQQTVLTAQNSQTPSENPNPGMIKGNNELALELFRQLDHTGSNVFYSPFSVSAALAMTYAGARNETAREMREALHFSVDLEKFNSDYAALINYMRSLNVPDSLELKIANGIFAEEDYSFSADYFKLVQDYYGARVRNMDFKKKGVESCDSINAWVEEQTRNKIQKLLNPSMIDALTRMVLVNAIYFHGNWQSPFDETKTRPMPFYLINDKQTEAKFMFEESAFRYLKTETAQMIELPYKGDNLSMIVLMPESGMGIEKFEKEISDSQLEEWYKSMVNQKLKLFLPKFKIECASDLSDPLQKLGMKQAFSLSADFSGMTGKKDLMIDMVVHKAFIEIDERGTEAAAATAVVMIEKSAMVNPEFRANRPFIFLIWDNTYHNILFMGRVMDPSK